LTQYRRRLPYQHADASRRLESKEKELGETSISLAGSLHFPTTFFGSLSMNELPESAATWSHAGICIWELFRSISESIQRFARGEVVTPPGLDMQQLEAFIHTYEMLGKSHIAAFELLTRRVDHLEKLTNDMIAVLNRKLAKLKVPK
jgi:hypothetical protein